MKCVLTADIGDKAKGDIVEVPPSDPDGLIGSGVAVPVLSTRQRKISDAAKKLRPSGVKDGDDS